MFRLTARLLFALVVITLIALAQPMQPTNSPIFMDEFNWTQYHCTYTPPTTNWYVNGTVNTVVPQGCPYGWHQTVGVTSTHTEGGSMIYKGSIPTGGEQEVRMQMVINSEDYSSEFFLYLNATNDARYKSTFYRDGSGYAIRIPISYGSTAGVKKLKAIVYKLPTSGSPLNLGSSSTIDVGLITTVRAVRTNAHGAWRIYVYINDVFAISVIDSTFSGGNVGIGIAKAPNVGAPLHSNTYINRMDVATVEHGTPDLSGLISGLSVIAAPNSIALQWGQATDTAGGSAYGPAGMSHYVVYRDGVKLATVISPRSFTDAAVSPSTLYNYSIRAYDAHGNYAVHTFDVETPSATGGSSISSLPRRTGLPMNVSTWGSGGESIDLLSGNLHFAYPLVTAVGRDGYAASLILSYNSQNWLRANSNTQLLAGNLGFGFGWRMQFGAIRPVYQSGYAISHFVYEDSTGAEYPLDILEGGTVWKPSEFAPILSYDTATNRAHFKDGGFWQFDCVSASGEDDKDKRYPTLMQDSAGNQIYIRYLTGNGASWPNSSARIDEIEDIRAQGSPRYTYKFQYTPYTLGTKSVPHLTGIVNNIGSGETYTLDYVAPPSGYLKSPVTPTDPYGQTRFLSWIATEGTENKVQFAYHSNDSGEITRITFPYGGYIDYTYNEFEYSGKKIREVVSRVLTPTPGGTSYTYDFSHDTSGDPSRPFRLWTRVIDASNASDKVWTFDTNPTSLSYSLWTQLDERELPSQSVKRRQTAFYNSQPPNKVFVYGVDTTMDPGTGNATTLRATQWLDGYGNLYTSGLWAYDNLVAPVRTVEYRYWSSWVGIYDRLQSVELHEGATVLTLQTNTYGNSFQSGVTCPPGIQNFDTSLCSDLLRPRGQITSTTSGGLTTNFEYDIQGNVVRTWGASPEVTKSFTSTTNFTIPEVITPNSTPQLSTSFTFDGAMRPSTATAPNNAVVQTWYDSYGRVRKTLSPTGAYSHYSLDYTNRVSEVSVSPDSSLNLTNRAFTKTTLDGLGRPIKVESGGGSSTVNSITETEYDTCACSPTGKVKRVSLPYSGGGPVKWTTYTYDALGRTLTVSLPDGAGTTQYEYVKNTVKIIDAAQKWKKYETNGFGQLVKVYEPNPAGGADLVTTYTYNLRGQLATAVMTRDGVTQTRTFNYDLATGRLTSVTKPETGTTSYTYNTDGTVADSIDAKNQKTAFTYDALKRVTEVKRYTWNGTSHVHQSCQDVEYDYDSGSGSNLWGRVAKIYSKICDATYVQAYEETFSYRNSGLLEYRDSRWVRNVLPPESHILRIQPTYNPMGLMTGYAYGNIGSLYAYTIGYDSAYRPISLTGEGLTLVDGVNYNAGGAMTAFTRRESGSVTVTNNYTFNTLYQMTNQTVARNGTPIQNLSYVFPTTNNNGQITQQIDHLASETVTYQYDALNRLTSAETADTDWGLAWTYDGFGNRTNQTVTKGSGPTHSVSVDKNTNRINTTGYQYDFNGNMTQMPLLAMTYDVANRMIASDHSSAGITYYGYNHANQRVYTRKDDAVDTITYMLYGLGGERLMEMEETCGGNCWDYQEKARWIYFAGRKMFQKTGSTLKAITPNRLASEAKHFPYGETDGTPPSDTKDYFATYRRDGTGLDYAWNRYYSPTMGRFTTADPYGGSVNLSAPLSWNRYSYTDDEPINGTDPTGLVTCGDLPVAVGEGGPFAGMTANQIMTGRSGEALLAQLVWHESGTLLQSDLQNTSGYITELLAVGSAVLNQWDIDNNRIIAYNAYGDRTYPLGSPRNRSLFDIIRLIAVDNAGPLFDNNGEMRASSRQRLNAALNSEIDAPPLVQEEHGNLFNINCVGLSSTILTVNNLLRSPSNRFSPSGLIVVAWDMRTPGTGPLARQGYWSFLSGRSNRGHTFWGLQTVPPPAPAPRPGVRTQPQGRVRIPSPGPADRGHIF